MGPACIRDPATIRGFTVLLSQHLYIRLTSTESRVKKHIFLKTQPSEVFGFYWVFFYFNVQC